MNFIKKIMIRGVNDIHILFFLYFVAGVHIVYY